MSSPTKRPAHEYAIEHALTHSTALQHGDFTLKSGVQSQVSISVMRLLHTDRMEPIYGHWAHHWFDVEKRGNVPAPTRLLGYGEEGERLGWGLQKYLNQEHRLTVVSDGRSAIAPLSNAFEQLNGQSTLILVGVIETPKIATWLARLADDVHANLLGVACIASLDPAITAETLRVPRLTVGWQLDCLIKPGEGV